MKNRIDIHGILLIDKPGLLSSNTVLQRVKFLLNARKAGHMGCLDPLATGMLPLCFGEATKFAQYGLDADKCYAVTARFGSRTTTGDAQGEVIQEFDTPISLTEILLQLPKFEGDSLQTPPMYSALKHQGKKLYELAREGKEVSRQARAITIHQFTLTRFDYPDAEFVVRCSKGTYIRTLIEDLGYALGSGAHVTALRRLYTAGFEQQRMYSLDECTAFSQEALRHCLLPMDSLLTHLPIQTLSDFALQKLYLGQSLEMKALAEGSLRLYDEQQHFQGLGEWDPNTNILKAKRLLANPQC
jgi:tRNA pseudouridine55 synthase